MRWNWYDGSFEFSKVMWYCYCADKNPNGEGVNVGISMWERNVYRILIIEELKGAVRRHNDNARNGRYFAMT